MIPPKSSKAIMALLVVFCLMLAGVIALEWLHPPQLDTVVAPHTGTPVAVTPESVALEPSRMAPLTQYQEIVERPLFLEGRRPPQPEAPATVVQEQPVVEDKSFTLLGVLITPEATLALLKVDETGKVHRIKVGDPLEGWRLEAIAADSVVLRRDAQTKTLQLVRNQKKPTAGPTAQEALRQRLLDQQRRRASLQNQNPLVNGEPINPAPIAGDGTPPEKSRTQ